MAEAVVTGLKIGEPPRLAHAFVPHPWGKDCCDGKVQEGERSRTCTQPRALHFTPAELEAELARLRLRIQELEHAAARGELAEAADPRPAQPQAPAEPWRSPGMGLYLHELLSVAYERVFVLLAPLRRDLLAPLRRDLLTAAEHFREHPPEAAAPLREERDRLAEKVTTLEEKAFNAALNYKVIEKRAERAEKAVSERDARIETLTQALGREIEAAREFVANAAKWNEKGDPRAAKAGLALAEQSLAKAAAALGAPEGQPRNDEVQTDPTITPEQAQRESDEATAAAYADEMRGEPCPVAPEGEPPAASAEAPLDALGLAERAVTAALDGCAGEVFRQSQNRQLGNEARAAGKSAAEPALARLRAALSARPPRTPSAKGNR